MGWLSKSMETRYFCHLSQPKNSSKSLKDRQAGREGPAGL